MSQPTLKKRSNRTGDEPPVQPEAPAAPTPVLTANQLLNEISSTRATLAKLRDAYRVSSNGLSNYQTKVENIKRDARRAIERITKGVRDRLQTVERQKKQIDELEALLLATKPREDAANLAASTAKKVIDLEALIAEIKIKLSQSAGNEHIRGILMNKLGAANEELTTALKEANDAAINYQRISRGA